MSVDLSIIGNHSMRFKEKEIADKSYLLELLNSLRLENSEFLKEMCIEWNSLYKYEKRKMSKKEKQKLENCLNIKGWKIDEYKDDDYCYDSLHYYLEGPYGLRLEINRYYFELSIWVGRYYHWFTRKEKEDILWREKWRLIIYKITNILGGKYVMYFPDNMSDLSAYWPCNYTFPKEMAEYFHREINDLNQVIQLISENYDKPLTLKEADRMYETMDKDPFVIDYFEDLDKTLII
ncbi:MAG: hypothetical protein ACOYU1_09500 [Bacteroidota bacterium]|jgi:hypothetical protein|nr:hypothetical protein [Dysgonamonadaceae bacterium]MDK2837869.1 hypothetical protein [Bacteroidota bacterium]MDN5291969.1 hypothetical protein [Anaerophaga sp.]MDN5296620.1 hypothetical protein [Bacteroidota bacterium]MDN5306166.1 hypothetical protein [Bacteroidota bacterium]